MKVKICLLSILIIFKSEAQEPTFSRGFTAWTKSAAEYRSKKFLIDSVFGNSSNTTFFEVDALATTASGELFTLAYNSYELKLAGLILTFWGSYSNKYGVVYNDFESKNLTRDSAVILLERLQREIDYISGIKNNDFNTFFSFSDMTFILNKNTNEDIGAITVRVFWKFFDAEWTINSIGRSKRRMEKWFKSK